MVIQSSSDDDHRRPARNSGVSGRRRRSARNDADRVRRNNTYQQAAHQEQETTENIRTTGHSDNNVDIPKRSGIPNKLLEEDELHETHPKKYKNNKDAGSVSTEIRIDRADYQRRKIPKKRNSCSNDEILQERKG
eukprot:jgi/Psemu1/60806/gm1.60806_g